MHFIAGASVALSIAFLLFFLGTLVHQGKGIFFQTYITLDIELSQEAFQGATLKDALANASYRKLIRKSLDSLFPEVAQIKDSRAKRTAKKRLYGLLSNDAEYSLAQHVAEDPELIGQTIEFSALADDETDLFAKGHIDLSLPENDRRVKDQQIHWMQALEKQGRMEKHFNTIFFTRASSAEPEQAGILGALIGSMYALLTALLLSFPIGIAAVIYLEEFAPKNRLTDLIEININNLAAVPSIIFGLLGLAVLLNFVGLPRSTPLVGGIVLALMTLPTIIIAGRASLKMVPNSLRQAGLSLGASKTQVVFHHILPLAMPGILTSTVIGMAQALGETAPLLMIGMSVFIVDIPHYITDSATALPVQIYRWFTNSQRAFVERTAGAILILLTFLIIMNLTAIILRNRFERKW